MPPTSRNFVGLLAPERGVLLFEKTGEAMEKFVENTLLLDFYGGLLTEKQQRFFSLYYNQDMSLSEIAKEEGISPQAVRDLLKRTEKLLEGYEKALGLAKAHRIQLASLEEALECLDDPQGCAKAKEKLAKAIDMMKGRICAEG
jgi:predicted DNA-binding protein YlxM (UPF0122 family)